MPGQNTFTSTAFDAPRFVCRPNALSESECRVNAERPATLPQCQERVTADTNLLLLSDGTPVCSTCSYQVSLPYTTVDVLVLIFDGFLLQCVVCGLPIMDEAIMTGAFQPPSFPSSRACLLPTRSGARSGAGELTFD